MEEGGYLERDICIAPLFLDISLLSLELFLEVALKQTSIFTLLIVFSLKRRCSSERCKHVIYTIQCASPFVMKSFNELFC